MQNNTPFVKNLYYFAILTTVVVATWMASALYYTFTETTIPENTAKHTTPISPTFDIETMNQVSNRISVPVDLSDTVDYTPLENNTSSELESEPAESTNSAPLTDISVPTQNPNPDEIL